MALERGKLAPITVVSSGATGTIITVASSKKVYIKSIMLFSPSGSTATAEVFVVPNGGSAGNSTKMFKIALAADETVLLEPTYPIVLDTDGDTLRVTATSQDVNVLITGDKEA